MRMIIGGSLRSLNSSRTLRAVRRHEMVRLSDENSRGKVQNVLCQERAPRGVRCCSRDEGRSFGAGFQEQASNSRKLLLPNGSGGERYGKGVSEITSCGDQRDERK